MSSNPNSKKCNCALVLPGAVSKGAYEAGVISVLAERDVQVDRIVATSSGALNGVAYAAGIRSGREKEMAAKLSQAWIERGGWSQVLNFHPFKLFSGRGFSDPNGLLKMLHEVVKPNTTSVKNEIELRIIVAPLNGVKGMIGHRPATTYESVIHFSGKDFDSVEGLEKIFQTATAACAFPGLFAPVKLPGIGPCLDGGTVNNAPIGYALDEGDVGHVIVPVPFPELLPDANSLQGLGLLNQLIDILINERLYRDLKDAELVNQQVAALEALVATGVLNEQQLRAVKGVFPFRHVKITEVRPSMSLGGNSFSGLLHQKERIKLVDEGRKAATRILMS